MLKCKKMLSSILPIQTSYQHKRLYLIIKLLSKTFNQKPRQIYLGSKFVNIIRCRFQSLLVGFSSLNSSLPRSRNLKGPTKNTGQLQKRLSSKRGSGIYQSPSTSFAEASNTIENKSPRQIINYCHYQ
jgi:hypothetical protein